MSYNLYFFGKRAEPSKTKEIFDSYFQSIGKYQCEHGQYIYDNKDTGVYFIFDLEDPEAYEADEKAYLETMESALMQRTGLSLTLNLFRPHIFGLEAEKEVSRLCARLDLKIIDPQQEDKHRDVTSREFLDGWIKSNQSGCKAILDSRKSEKEMRDLAVHSMPSAELERCWSWNYRKSEYQNTLGPEIYVPTILPLLIGGKPYSGIVWGDAIPQAIPPVDYVVLVREEIKKKRLFGEKRETFLVKMAELEGILEGADRVDHPFPHYVIKNIRSDEGKISILQSFPVRKEKFTVLPWEKVLDEEDVRGLL